MKPAPNILLNVLTEHGRINQLFLAEWDLLIRQARSAGLLAALFDIVQECGHVAVAEGPYNHLRAARILTDKHQRDVRWEVRCIADALENVESPVVLLKGAAYLMADLSVAKGRFFSDIDILVPKINIDEVEQTLRLKGWVSGSHDAYDQRYYRTWMHELPPLRHRFRNTVLDVHHNILPTTAKLRPDAKKLLQNAVPLEGYTSLYVLAPADMVLHSATHLFSDGELEHGLRDLYDLDGLLRHFGTRGQFWDELVERAVEMDLGRPLYYALTYTSRLLATPVPTTVVEAAAAVSKPAKPLAALMDVLLPRALMPDHPSCDDVFTPLARSLLYIRSHHLRMPLYLLLPHLFHKAFISEKGAVSRQETELEKQ